MTRNTTPFLLNLSDFGVHEPDVSNDEFLDSLDKIGVWLRVLAAYDSLNRYSSPDSSRTQRMAALSNIYLQLGAQLEDQAVSLIVFSVWSKNRDLVLADLFSRTFVTRPRKSMNGSEIAATHVKLADDRPDLVRVDQRAFFGEVAEMDDAAIVEFFLGYKGRAVPSEKLIPRKHIRVWKHFPEELRRIASSFYDERHTPRITAAYNKLKHGPQLILQNPIDRARQFSTIPNFDAQLAGYRSFDKTGIRLLFAGAKTRREPEDFGVGSVAPFLVDDEGAVKKLFFETMVYQATLFSTLVSLQLALYRKSRFEIGSLDEGVLRILKEARQRLPITGA